MNDLLKKSFLNRYEEKSAMKRTAALLLIALSFCVLTYPSSSLPEATAKAILVRPQKALQTEEDIDSIITFCEKYRITHIFLMVKQDAGPESGLVYYTSSRIPRIFDFDVLSRMLEKAHRRNIKVYAWLPLLYDRHASDSGLGIGDGWICPQQSISYYTAMVNEVKVYGVDGILFDYLRFSDDFAASDQMKTDFGKRFGYNMEFVELSLEKERATQLWSQWISYRNEMLSTLLKAIVPQTIPAGVTATPGDLENGDSEPGIFSLVDFVAAQPEENPALLINQVTLSTEAAAYVIIPNDYVSEVRQLVSESTYADLFIFDSDTWSDAAFQRIKEAEAALDSIRMTELAFIDFLNNQYDMRNWSAYEVNAVVLPAGHVFWTYFKFLPYKEKWSAYTQKYNRDYVEEMISQSQEAGLYAILELDIQSEEYVTKYKDAASINYRWGVVRNRVCLTELGSEPYKTEFLEMAQYLAENYTAEALLITNISYLEDCFCTDCLESYIAFMAEKGIAVEDWPRTNGEIDIYNRTIGEWKTVQITRFLRELKESLRDSNKELWVEVPISENLEYLSSEYGLHLPEVEPVVDRIVLTHIDIANPPRIENVVNSLPQVGKYLLNFPVETGIPPTRTYLLDSLKTAYENGIDNVGVYPQSTMTDSLWSAFYIAYAYKLALADEDLMDIYLTGDYGRVISTSAILEEEKKEEEKQARESARQNIKEAERTYLRVLSTLEEAKQVDLNVAAFEVDIQQNLSLLSDAEQLFVEGNYQSAEEKGKTAIIEFSTLDGKINNLVRAERLKRITSGVLILVVFLLIMMSVRFKMRKKK